MRPCRRSWMRSPRSETAPRIARQCPRQRHHSYTVERWRLPKAAREADQVITTAPHQQPFDSDMHGNPCHHRGAERRWHADGPYSEPGAPHASAVDRRDRRHSRKSIWVVAPDIGGGFGAKMHLYPEELLCPYLRANSAYRSNGGESRSESHQSTSHGRAHTEIIEVAIRKDGTILGMKVETLGNAGAYLSNMATGGPTVNTVDFGTGNYKIDALRGNARVVVTNTVPVDAYRGYGRPEGAYIAERAIDAVARHPRPRPGRGAPQELHSGADFPFRPYSSKGTIFDSGDYEGCLDKALAAFDYRGAAASANELRREGRYRGIGVAAYTQMCGMAPSRRLALIGFDRGGWESARVSRGFSRQGHDLFGLHEPGPRPPDFSGADRRRRPADSGREYRCGPRRHATGAGRPRHIQFALDGCRRLKRARLLARIVAKARKIAASMMEVDEKDISYKAGQFTVPGTDIAPLSFEKVARMAYVGHVCRTASSPA